MKKDYDVIISVDDVTNKILSCDSNYIVDVFMRLKFGNYSISMREVITTSIVIQRLFLRVVLVQVQWLGTGTRYKLEILHQCAKRVKTKSQKIFGANSYVCRSYSGKGGSGGGAFCPSPHPE